ncbi:uncharacterized protein LOC123300284 [Chrysoperla carnea]|uniref:uncharacterized protein LOC123300284 n=1 Tax=Chrysoperla carnea TaxID=189513 RepID=UPI001D0968BB|nr:uncharacterized protein LOC123300284 [Chrysoperla carnea]
MIIKTPTVEELIARRKMHNWNSYYGQMFQYPIRLSSDYVLKNELLNSSAKDNNDTDIDLSPRLIPISRKPQTWEEGPLVPLGITVILAFLLILLVVFRQNPTMTIATLLGCLVSLSVVLFINNLHDNMPVYY